MFTGFTLLQTESGAFVEGVLYFLNRLMDQCALDVLEQNDYVRDV